MDIEETYRIRITDERVKVLIKKYTNISTIVDYQNISDDKKEKCTIKLYQKGASIRQISRLTGVSKKIIEKWINNTKK